MKALAIAALALTLAACATRPVAVRAELPEIPADIRQCIEESRAAAIPDADLTVSDVEALWKDDRARRAIVARCGRRFLAWYEQLQRDWH